MPCSILISTKLVGNGVVRLQRGSTIAKIAYLRTNPPFFRINQNHRCVLWRHADTWCKYMITPSTWFFHCRSIALIKIGGHCLYYPDFEHFIDGHAVFLQLQVYKSMVIYKYKSRIHLKRVNSDSDYISVLKKAFVMTWFKCAYYCKTACYLSQETINEPSTQLHKTI